MWARGVYSWGSEKVAGRVFFVSLRIHAGGRVADRQRAVGHQKWRGIETVLRWVCITDNPCGHEPWMGKAVEGHCGDVACVSFVAVIQQCAGRKSYMLASVSRMMHAGWVGWVARSVFRRIHVEVACAMHRFHGLTLHAAGGVCRGVWQSHQWHASVSRRIRVGKRDKGRGIACVSFTDNP